MFVFDQRVANFFCADVSYLFPSAIFYYSISKMSKTRYFLMLLLQSIKLPLHPPICQWMHCFRRLVPIFVVTLLVTEKIAVKPFMLTIQHIHAYVSQCPIVLLLTLFCYNSLSMQHIYPFT